MDIHKRIKSRREECQLTVEEVASALGVSRSTIYRYESSEILNIGLDKLEPLARVLHTTPEYLMGWTDDPIDYDDGELIAEIPSCYVEACGGNIKYAHAMMQAASLDAKSHSGIDRFQEYSTDIIEKLKVLAAALDELNTDGQERVVEYAEDLVTCGRYKKVNPSEQGKKQA